MTRANRSFFLLLVLAIASSNADAQGPVAGTPPFGSFSGGPEIINNANLNAHWTIPMLNKAGRGTNFIYDLGYDSSVWYPVTSGSSTTWTPVLNWGWQAQTGAATGYVSFTQSATICLGNDDLDQTIHMATNFVYHDPFGSTHPFPGTAMWGSPANLPGCTYLPKQTIQILASDSSGYTISVAPAPTGVTWNFSMLSATGKLTLLPSNSTTGAGSSTDRNGNQISVDNSGHFYDTLSSTVPVLAATGLGTVASPITLTYTTPSGAAASYKVNYTNYTVATNFGISSISETKSPAAVPLVSSIVLPDNSQYTFTYEATPSTPAAGACTPYAGTTCVTARIASVTLPTGGEISYSYYNTNSNNFSACTTGNNGVFSDGSASCLQRTTPDGTWTYVRTLGSGATAATLITAPKLSYDSTANQSILQFQGIYQTQGDVYQGTAPTFTLPISESTLQAANLLQETQMCYNASASPCTSTAVTLPISQLATITQLDTSGLQSKSAAFYNAYGLLTELDEYDYGSGAPGSLLKKTLISYASLGNNINASQQTVTICNGTGSSSNCNGTGTVVAQTQFYYDETGVTATTGTPQHLAVSGSRGNLTTVKYFVQGAAYLSKSYSYYDTGNVNVATDLAGAQTTYTYGTCGNSLPTKQVTANGLLSVSNSMAWDCNGGLLTSTTDTNSQSTSYSYDSGWRLTTLTRPDNVQLTYQYPTSASLTYVVTTPIQGTNSVVSTTTLDGLGRTTRNSTSDNSQNTYSIVDTQYDALGRGYMVSNPYISGTKYWTTTQFDALGRATIQTQQDGAQTANSYSGRTTTVTDPATKKRKYDYDAAGRIVNAWEPDPIQNNSLTVQTSYTYTARDQISGITQGAQSRGYVYDLMGRLTSMTIPEAGQVSFQYNSAGLVSQRTDARNVQTNYVYDGLSRLTGKNYSIPQGSTSAAMPNVCDPTGGQNLTQNVCFFYDQGGSAAYALGRLTKIVDSSGSEAYTFDQLGRSTQVSKTVGTTTYNTNYLFNLANEPTTVTYPSGRVVLGTYDAIGRVCAIGISSSTCSSGTTYATGLTYNPAGQLTNVTYGNGVTGTFGYSADRLQLGSVGYSKGPTNLLNLDYWYKQDSTNCPNGVSNNNGQIQCITDTVDSGRNLALGYDALYRLTSAVTTGSSAYPKWGLSWAYDRYGNRLNQTQTAGNPPTNSLSFSNPGGAQTNRQDNMCFDASGNLLAETAAPCPSPTYIYDGENRLVGYHSAAYTVDTAGMRVKKQVPGTTTVYIFSGSKVIAEYDNGAAVTSPSREYIYAGTGLLAKIEGGVINYYHNDHLSARILTDSSGNVLGQRGLYPFGETWYEPGTTTEWKFTSYERDSESTNDYAVARSFVNRFGRFSGSDPIGGGLDDPQSINRYSYVLNDPCNQADPLGLKSTCILNIKLNAGSGVTLSDADKAAITNRINAILGSTMTPGGDSVQIQTSYSGDADYALNFVKDDKALELGVMVGQVTLGDAPIGGKSGNVYVDAVYFKTGTYNTNVEGGVGAHELFHLSAKVPDETFDINNINIMMFNKAPKEIQNASLKSTASGLWSVPSSVLQAMYNDCVTKHKPPPPAGGVGGVSDIGQTGPGGGNFFWFNYMFVPGDDGATVTTIQGPYILQPY